MKLENVKRVFDIAKELTKNEIFMPDTDIPCDFYEQKEIFNKKQLEKIKFIDDTFEELKKEWGKK